MSDIDLEYGANQIQVLEGLEAVRKRPGMYIGSTGSRGLHHLVYEIVDNSIDEALAGFCTKIIVEILPENIIRVRDNGRGIPVGIHPKLGMISPGAMMTGLLANAGVGLLVLFRVNHNRIQNVKIVGVIYLISVMWGIVTELAGISF